MDDSFVLIARNRTERAERLVIGVIAASVRSDELEIQGIAVAPSARARGIGGTLVSALVTSSASDRCTAPVTAETDGNAVAFSRALGFRVTSLGELFLCVERFDCRRST